MLRFDCVQQSEDIYLRNQLENLLTLFTFSASAICLAPVSPI